MDSPGTCYKLRYCCGSLLNVEAVFSAALFSSTAQVNSSGRRPFGAVTLHFRGRRFTGPGTPEKGVSRFTPPAPIMADSAAPSPAFSEDSHEGAHASIGCTYLFHANYILDA